jgi:hypothetical protein
MDDGRRTIGDENAKTLRRQGRAKIKIGWYYLTTSPSFIVHRPLVPAAATATPAGAAPTAPWRVTFIATRDGRHHR